MEPDRKRRRGTNSEKTIGKKCKQRDKDEDLVIRWEKDMRYRWRNIIVRQSAIARGGKWLTERNRARKGQRKREKERDLERDFNRENERVTADSKRERERQNQRFTTQRVMQTEVDKNTERVQERQRHITDAMQRLRNTET